MPSFSPKVEGGSWRSWHLKTSFAEDGRRRAPGFDFKGISLFGSLREPLDGANRAKLERAFRGTGLTPSAHFLDQLANHRLRKSGMTSLGDVQRLLRNGRQILQIDRGSTIKITDGIHYIAFNPKTKTLITISPGK